MRDSRAQASAATNARGLVLRSTVAIHASVPTFASERTGGTVSGVFIHNGTLFQSSNFDPVAMVRKVSGTMTHRSWEKEVRFVKPRKCAKMPNLYVRREVFRYSKKDALRFGLMTLLDYDLASLTVGKVLVLKVHKPIVAVTSNSLVSI